MLMKKEYESSGSHAAQGAVASQVPGQVDRVSVSGATAGCDDGESAGPSSATTEERILAAAEEEFLSRGYAGAKMMSIAERAGVTHPMLHYYFRSKDKLFRHVYDEKIRQLGESLFVIFQRTDLPFRERVVCCVSQHFDFIARNPRLPAFVIHEMQASEDLRQQFSERFGRVLGRILPVVQREADQLAACGEIAPVSVLDLMVDVASLNVFVFAAQPILSAFILRPGESCEEYLCRKKQENIELILYKLQKNTRHETSSPFYF